MVTDSRYAGFNGGWLTAYVGLELQSLSSLGVYLG